MQENHATISKKKGKYFLTRDGKTAKVLHNGKPVTDKVELHHNDRSVVRVI